jgi:peptidyl-dipeptidase A
MQTKQIYCVSVLALVCLASAAPAPSPQAASDFLAAAEAELAALSEMGNRVNWVNSTYITEDSDWLAAKAGEAWTSASVRLAKQAARFDDATLSSEEQRKLKLLKLSLVLPAPDAPGAAAELSVLATRLQSTYGKGQGRYRGALVSGNDLEEKMGTERDAAMLEEMWTSWHDVGKPMKSDYARLVEIANAGSRELGFSDTGALWRSGYDMPADQFAQTMDELWLQLRPFYTQLHCNVRKKLNQHYGDAVQPRTGPIRAHLLGNMWAQQWHEIYDIVKPAQAAPAFDMTAALVKANFTPIKITQTADGFFQSLGFAPLPESFYTRSLFVKPADREVVCHASAWNIDNQDDVRIKMCTKINGSDFVTVHHEIGHNIYQRAYKNQPFLFKNSANDGFHEAVGDWVALSVTPNYLMRIGVLEENELPSAEADLGLLYKTALDKMAFLPWGLLVDKWRWEVFSGKLTPETYNSAWWKLRLDYQGVVPPVARPADAFDPGAKYHIPGNTPYARYFLARILQFQFHEAACRQAGWKGPLHQCSIYGNKQVGARFAAMLEMGASRPWPEALQAATGKRSMDAGAMVRYFQPVMSYLKRDNKREVCGW